MRCIISERIRTPGVYRTPYTKEQTEELERQFAAQPKIGGDLRKVLSERIGLQNRQIKYWFQNARAKREKLRSLSAQERPNKR